MEAIQRVRVEELHETGERSIPSPSTVEVSGVEQLRDQLDEMADSLDVSGFKCPKCNLAHGHDTTKHRLSDTYDISDDEAAGMEYNSVCHCGLHEASRRGSEFGIDENDAASKASGAPIPPSESRRMDEKFGSA